MLYFDRIDVSDRIDVNKTSESKYYYDIMCDIIIILCDIYFTSGIF